MNLLACVQRSQYNTASSYRKFAKSQKFQQSSSCNLQSRIIRNCHGSIKKSVNFLAKHVFKSRKISETRHRNNMHWKVSSRKIF